MTNERRNFLKTAALGAGIIAAGSIAKAECAKAAKLPEILDQVNKDQGKQAQNMCGFAAPPIKNVRIAVIGLGNRGPNAVNRMAKLKGVTVVALCDLIRNRAEKCQQTLINLKQPKAKIFSGENGWKDLCKMEDLDLVYIVTPWRLHTPMAVYAMECGKHAAVDVPAATTVEECWQLVNTSERTKKHCMQLENCCYDNFEMMTLNMTRKGVFGEIVHAEAAYIHDLISLNTTGHYQGRWRLQQNLKRNGNLYPTHGLGPVSQCMNINRGDQYSYMTSMSSKDVNLGPAVKARLKNTPYAKSETFRGNMNTSIIKTANGNTIMVQHDVNSTRPYSRIHLLSGSKAMCRKYPIEMVAFTHRGGGKRGKELIPLKRKYEHPLYKRMGAVAKSLGGHGGMDGIMDARLIECLNNGAPLDQDVYDAAAWSVIAPLSEWSVANRSNSIDVPDFTRGAWKKNTPLAIVE
ncbi:MAG: Gfo/Idh/MocA family oxidoreductase [Phycisphaerales bacterium]|nr:Gfo/Idh/MocA family oxidoreductase [Phycisphaerales bacterium]